MNNIEIFNETDQDIVELEKVEEVLEFAANYEGLNNVSFNVIIVDNNYIHTLNSKYRGIDRETDVITFALEDEKDMVNNSGIRVLGDIYISIDKAISQKNEYGHSLLRELTFLAVHGFYHLLGYDHMNEADEKIMFSKQDEILNKFNITRNKEK